MVSGVAGAVGGVLAPAVAVGLSPFGVVGVVLVLGSPHARTSGPAFAAGWVAGLVAVSAVAVALTGDVDEPGSVAANGVGWVELALGVALLYLAARKWRKRRRPGEEVVLPGWMATIGDAGPGRAVGLGVTLMVANPKNLALTVSAAASIGQTDVVGTGLVVAVAAFVVLGSVPVVGAVLAHLVLGERAAAALGSVKEFMIANNDVVVVVLLLVFGFSLVGDGLSDLPQA
ncbi:membrane protein [Pseudonocardia hydrocarbonoxydans]|uniref:Membrane protein n=1 Tax=Pseudonocardia hydrocarbonoxydans TaxID=76726 RepID=A0A4Y3WNS1_9PSEU|nr:membrane protein [Pseudonocardia hydrocarbonoxydans]